MFHGTARQKELSLTFAIELAFDTPIPTRVPSLLRLYVQSEKKVGSLILMEAWSSKAGVCVCVCGKTMKDN